MQTPRNEIRTVNRLFLITILGFFAVIIGTEFAVNRLLPNASYSTQDSIVSLLSYTALAIPALIYGSRKVSKPEITSDRGDYLFAFIAALIVYPVLAAVDELAQNIGVTSQVTDEIMTSTITNMDLFTGLLTLALLPAIVEELIFRKTLCDTYVKQNPIGGIILSAAVFALMHMNLRQIPYAFVGGLFLGWIYVTTQSVFTSIIAHFTINGASVVFGKIAADFSTKTAMDTGSVIWTGIMYVIGITVAAAYLFKNKNKKLPNLCGRQKINIVTDTSLVGKMITLSLFIAIVILIFGTCVTENLLGLNLS